MIFPGARWSPNEPKPLARSAEGFLLAAADGHPPVSHRGEGPVTGNKYGLWYRDVVTMVYNNHYFMICQV